MQTEQEWLRGGGVEVWHARPAQAESAAAYLTMEERAQADALRLESARQRYLVGHAVARQRLGELLELEPQAVPLVRLASGKPTLALAGPRFNLAHSGEVVLCAIAWEREVGVDVEAVRPRPELQLAQRYFLPAEAAAIAAVEAEERRALFARCWTRKEALLKACDTPRLMPGLMELCEPFQLERPWHTCTHRGRTWAVGDVPLPVPAHTAAVAVEGSALELRVREWRG